MTKLIVAFRNVVIAPKNQSVNVVPGDNGYSLCESYARNTQSEGKMQNFLVFQQAAHILNTGRAVINYKCYSFVKFEVILVVTEKYCLSLRGKVYSVVQ